AEPLERASAVPIPEGRGETILLVEDDESVRGLTRTTLERHGYSVLEASGPADALLAAAAFEGPINLLLTDMVMAGSTGTDLARDLAEVRADTKVLFMSGY